MTSAPASVAKKYQTRSSAISRSGELARHAAIFFLSAFGAFVLQPRIGVRDADACGYILGAYSIQAGNGYQDLTGESMNHYPPGYSLILSLFPWPLQAALLLNYLSLGAAVVLIYRMARDGGKWTELSALGLALAIGFIFLRRIASNAIPDVLAYALFLFALFLHYRGNSRLRMASYLIWGALIPIKLIAVAFIPAAVLARYLGKSLSFIRAEKLEVLVALASWSLFFAGILVFNSLTIQSSMPGTLAPPNPGGRSLFGAASQFLATVPRTFLSNWYGSIGTASALIPFCVVLLLALVCLSTLRLYSRRLAMHAALLILLSATIQFASHQASGARLTGYGMIALLLAFHPAAGWHRIWVLYGLLGVGLGAYNALTRNALGANDPRYEKLARESLAIETFPKKVATNSFHILDIHARLATRHVKSIEEARDGEHFFWVSLPLYDAIATTVAPVKMPGEGWCETARLDGAILFQKCPKP